MGDVKEIINNMLKSIQEQNSFKSKELRESNKIVKDLGFSSLDVAQLIAMLEIELGVDPFAQGVSIMDVHTIGELYSVYEKSLMAA